MSSSSSPSPISPGSIERMKRFHEAMIKNEKADGLESFLKKKEKRKKITEKRKKKAAAAKKKREEAKKKRVALKTKKASKKSLSES